MIAGIDQMERRASFIAAGLALVSAALFIPNLEHDTRILDTAAPTKGHLCTSPFTWNPTLKTCTHLKVFHPSSYVFPVVFVVMMALVIFLFAWRRKRVGIAFGGFFLGLALNTFGSPLGLIFLVFGGWLMLRALRLQRYGDPTFFGSSRLAREQAKARREGAVSAPRAERTRSAPRGGRSRRGEPATTRPTGPSASKRYTPKKPPPRKR